MRCFAIHKKSRRLTSKECDLVAFDTQHRALAQADDSHAGISMRELDKAFVTRFPHVPFDARVRIVRVYLKGDESEGL